MKSKKQHQIIYVFAFALSGCAFLHHAQYGDIDNRHKNLTPFEIKISETGINIEEAAAIVKGVSQSQAGKQATDDIAQIIGMFQQGPHTGNGVYNDTYAEGLLTQLRETCPSGRITGLNAVRETRKYPVISGEIVKVSGYCIKG